MLELKARGGVWYVMGTVKTIDGVSVPVRKSTGFPLHQKAMAEVRLSQILAQAVKGEVTAKARKRETVSELIRIYAAKPDGMGETNARHLASFEELHGKKTLDELTVKDINDWGYVAGHSPDYVRRRLAAVNTMLTYCRGYGVVVPWDLKAKLPPEQAGRKRYLKKDERDRFIEEMRKHGPYFGAVALFMFYTGARIGEALKLRWRDVDMAMEQATVSSKKGRYKREKSRPLPLVAEVIEELAKLPRRNEWVFSMVRSGPLTYCAVQKKWKLCCESLGVEDFRPHDARHTFASLLGQTGEADLQDIQELLGHESIQMTLRYKHTLPAKTARAVKALSSKWVAMSAAFAVAEVAQILHSMSVFVPIAESV